MADTAVLRVDVASTDFDKFQTSFNAYAKTLESTLATWSKITTEVKAASAVMNNMAAPVARSTASLQKFTQQFAETSKHTASIRTNVESITKGLVSWRTAIGSTIALLGLGGGGLFGLASLVQGVVGDRSRALGMGVGYGQFRGMNAGSFPGAGAAMAGWGTARWDPTSGAYRGAQTLFGQDTNRQLSRTDPLAMADALEKATRYLGQFDEKIRGTIAATSGLNDLLGPEAIRTWMALDKQEIEVRRQAIAAAGDAAKMAEESVKKWTTFNIALESSKSVIQDVLIDRLAPLAGPLTNLSKSMNNAVQAFLDTPVIKQAIADMAAAIQQFSDYLNSPDGKKAITDFANGLMDAYKQIKGFADGVEGVLNTLLAYQKSFGEFMQGIYAKINSWLPWHANAADQSKQIVPGQANPITLHSLFGSTNDQDRLNAATTIPIPSSVSGASGKPQQELMGATGMLGGGQYMEWFKGWFVQEQQSTKAAARAAADRDESTQRLMGNLDNYFMTEAEKQDKLNKTLEDFNTWLNKMGVGGGGGTGPGGLALGPGTGGGAGGPQGAGGSGPHSRTSSAGGPGGGGSGSFLDAVSNIESSNRNIVQGIHDVNTDKGTPASGYFQIIDPTWRKYAAKAGVDLTKYPTPMSAPRDVQAQVAAQIPANQFGGRTQRMLHEQFGAFDKNKTLGELNEQFGGQGGGAAGASAMANATPNSTSEIRGPGGSNAADANALLAEVKKTHPHLSNEQCVTLVREFSGMGGTVRDWRKGQNVLSGNMKVGTPIATFMSSSGQQSERYDAGGIGTPGAGTSHAALFGGYTRDQSGKITGINVVEQYKYSGRRGQVQGPHIQHYGIGGFGEHGAENYFGIAGAGGGKKQGGTNGLDNDNWQQKPIHNVNIHNRTGSDVNIAASTVMASA
jgi:hypothetical protein